MSETVSRHVDDLIAQMRAGSAEGFRGAVAALGESARAGGPAALTAAIEALAPQLPALGGTFAKAAVLAGACVEWGGSPVALAQVLPERAALAMEMFAMVPGIWVQEVPDRFPPAPDAAVMDEVVRVVEAVSARNGSDADVARSVEPVLRRFRLFDGHGGYVAPEGIPADIRPLNGVRVLVLHPPHGSFGWVNGRVFEQMEPSLRLDRRMSRREAADWLGRITPARETDLMEGPSRM